MNFIQRLFTSKKKLIEELEKTKTELTDCGNKLLEKQEHINSTNAYWKKKMYAVKAQKNKEN
jgi:transposase